MAVAVHRTGNMENDWRWNWKASCPSKQINHHKVPPHPNHVVPGGFRLRSACALLIVTADRMGGMSYNMKWGVDETRNQELIEGRKDEFDKYVGIEFRWYNTNVYL